MAPGPRERPATVLQGGRAKAYRPLPVEARAAAVEEGLEAYGRGDAFLAHELLEPAWMGTAEEAERELLQGLIKLAAGYVHAARDNSLGVAKNLSGARQHLAAAEAATVAGATIVIPELASIDVPRLIGAIDRIVARVARDGDVPLGRPTIRHRARDR
ncbi:MAG TPA: DUF309 domain-containing protein [Candidatus Limnocylindrales bacterium]